MTPDELKARVAEFMENNDLHDDGEHTCGYSHDLLGHNLESLCREMIAAGIQKVATHLRTQHLQEFGHARLLGAEGALYDWCQAEAQRVKDGER